MSKWAIEKVMIVLHYNGINAIKLNMFNNNIDIESLRVYERVHPEKTGQHSLISRRENRWFTPYREPLWAGARLQIRAIESLPILS